MNTQRNMLEIDSLVGEYKIEKLVGEGGMGQVYGAVHPLIGKRAAIKVLRGELCADPEAIDRFVLEARAVNQIGHPNIVDVFAFGSLPDGRQYMVMEWLRGESLDQRIRRMLPTLEETCEIMLSICAALDAAHAEQIVHRDLKPHNVFMSHARGMKPAVKLLDFGLVKLVGDGQVERTRSGSMLGTPAYMSPEQARGRGVDHRTDLYALGVMLFELVTGTLPFLEQSAMEMVMAHIQATPPAPSSIRPGLPPLIDQLVLGLLDKDPAYRPTMSQIIGVLGDVQRLAASAPQALTPTLIATHPHAPASSPQSPTLISSPAQVSTQRSGQLPANQPPTMPMVSTQTSGQLPPGHGAPAMPQYATQVSMSGQPRGHGMPSAGMSAPIAMMAPSVASPPASVPMMIPSMAPVIATGSVPAQAFAHASVAQPAAVVDTPAHAESIAAPKSRRLGFAILAMLAVGGIAFGVVMALRGESTTPETPAVATPAAVTPDAAVMVIVDAAVTVAHDAAEPTELVDAAMSVDAAIVVVPPDAKSRPRPRDAGVAKPDAAAAPADAGKPDLTPDAAIKPVDDGDGLLPSKGTR